MTGVCDARFSLDSSSEIICTGIAEILEDFNVDAAADKNGQTITAADLGYGYCAKFDSRWQYGADWESSIINCISVQNVMCN